MECAEELTEETCGSSLAEKEKRQSVTPAGTSYVNGGSEGDDSGENIVNRRNSESALSPNVIIYTGPAALENPPPLSKQCFIDLLKVSSFLNARSLLP